MLKNKNPSPAAPPEVTVADLDRIRINKAKARIHHVRLRYFPSCKRLARLQNPPPQVRATTTQVTLVAWKTFLNILETTGRER